MGKVKKGDIVGRKSYGKDVLFMIEKIIKLHDKTYVAILKGITVRIEADAPIEDLEVIEESRIQKNMRTLDAKLETRIKRYVESQTDSKRQYLGSGKEKIVTGKILHLDGDRKYSEKSLRYYKSMGLNAIVKNVPEYKQPYVVKNLIKKYNPDILVITGHDGMIKNGIGYNDIYNYRNSKYFLATVTEAKKVKLDNELVIFAGACQSFFEVLMEAGANFASSPSRILIDFMDPLIVAEKIATTEDYKYLTISDISYELRDGEKRSWWNWS